MISNSKFIHQSGSEIGYLIRSHIHPNINHGKSPPHNLPHRVPSIAELRRIPCLGIIRPKDQPEANANATPQHLAETVSQIRTPLANAP
jgi:hypothetical protein